MSKQKNIILVGGGGHCHSVIDVIENIDDLNILGILDSKIKDTEILGYPILGGDDLIPKLVNDNTFFLISVGQIKSCSIRKKIDKILFKNNAKLATIVSPSAYVSKHAIIEEGSIIMNHAIVNAGAKIGRNCIINTKSNIEHNVEIGQFSHISTCAVINGNSLVGNECFIGSNATISNGINIRDNSIISAGKFVK